MDRQGEGTQSRLSIVVPTRNEADNIATLLARLAQALRQVDFEVLFVDDSTDTTPEIITTLAAQSNHRPIKLIHRSVDQRNGLSGAVVEGIAAAQGEWVCIIDADLQHPPEAVLQLLEQAERTGADLVVASRRADFIGPVGLSRARALTSQSLTILARTLFPRVLKNVSDPLTGFFLVRRSALALDTLQPEGFKILLEILVRHPELHVSEIFFDFAPRHEGQSKADLHEGMRYFRHLTRLRWSVNRHLARFLLVILLAVGVNLLLLATLVGRLDWPLLTGAALAGAVTILSLLAGEAWVFSDRNPGYTRRRLTTTLLLSSLYLLIVYLPMLGLMSRLGIPYLAAALLALSVAGFVYYLFSEYWIWTRGLMMRPRSHSYYDIHGLLTIASQVPLNELAHFLVAGEPERIDIQLRVDRHGTPSHPAGALSYDEHLGRFGFGLTVIPGQYSEIVVSPLLESSPSFLYTNVVEPVIHWMLVSRDYAFLPVAAMATGAVTPGPVGSNAAAERAILVYGAPNMAYGLVQLAINGSMAFMGDDRVILGENGLVYSYPKPVTVNQAMLRQASAATRAVAPLLVQRLVYSRRVRQLGIWLGGRRLPAATLNTYLQRLMPQPKYDISELAPRIRTADSAAAGTLVILDPVLAAAAPSVTAVLDNLVGDGWLATGATAGFQPLTQLSLALATWDSTDWITQERQIAQRGLHDVVVQLRPGIADKWWTQVSASSSTPSSATSTLTTSLTVRQT